jgi:glycosyltransferase involved in cell wall biosynthesis
MNIALICPYPFPIGQAATNRIISYSRGLVEINNLVKVIILRPTEKANNIINKDITGKYAGISFQYSWKDTIWPSGYIKKIIVFILSFFNSILIMSNDNSVKKVDCIISSTDFGFINITLFLLSKLIDCKFVYIADEYPYPIRYGRKPSLIRKFSIAYLFRLFDGIIVMTDALKKYFKDKAGKDAKFLVMPITVETERFINKNELPPISGDYIIYAGDLDRNKAAVLNLIEAFKTISGEFPTLKLCIAGGTKKEADFNEYIKIISEARLAERIIMTGIIHRDKIPCYLNNAAILAIAEPRTYRSEMGFPTKLGEYLATGKPVVCTAVGEIPNYLTDGINAFLVEPGNNEKFAGKLKFVLENPEAAEKVGKEGQKVVLNTFNYKIQARHMNSFLRGL